MTPVRPRRVLQLQARPEYHRPDGTKSVKKAARSRTVSTCNVAVCFLRKHIPHARSRYLTHGIKPHTVTGSSGNFTRFPINPDAGRHRGLLAYLAYILTHVSFFFHTLSQQLA
jgi:hypothetical protein